MFSKPSKTQFSKPKDVSEPRYHELFKAFYITQFRVCLLAQKHANFSNLALFFSTLRKIQKFQYWIFWLAFGTMIFVCSWPLQRVALCHMHSPPYLVCILSLGWHLCWPGERGARKRGESLEGKGNCWNSEVDPTPLTLAPLGASRRPGSATGLDP